MVALIDCLLLLLLPATRNMYAYFDLPPTLHPSAGHWHRMILDEIFQSALRVDQGQGARIRNVLHMCVVGVERWLYSRGRSLFTSTHGTPQLTVEKASMTLYPRVLL